MSEIHRWANKASSLWLGKTKSGYPAAEKTKEECRECTGFQICWGSPSSGIKEWWLGFAGWDQFGHSWDFGVSLWLVGEFIWFTGAHGKGVCYFAFLIS